MKLLLQTFRVLTAGLILATTVGAQPPITDLAIAPDGRHIVAVSRYRIQVRSTSNLEILQDVESRSAALHCAAFSPDGRFLATGGGTPSESGHVEIYSWPQLDLVTVLTGHDDSVLSAAWLTEDVIASAGMDRKTVIQSVSKLSQQDAQTECIGHSRSVTDVVSIREGGLLVTAGHDFSLRVWDPATGELQRSLRQHTGLVHALAARPNTEGLPVVASSSADRTIRFWQPTIGRMMRYIRLDAHPLDLTWAGPHRIAAACDDGSVAIVDADSVRMLSNEKVTDAWLYAVAWEPRSEALFAAGEHGVIRRIPLKEPQ